MENYINEGKKYKVDEVKMAGMIIVVNGKTIKDYSTMEYITGDRSFRGLGYSVLSGNNEFVFDSFQDAYDFAFNN